ncbi:hypothetical protein [Ottowia cancrivicina]|uniref:Uncharacterized protein n=1 Tax=Ottowia cancrivicina TaxID=3040346 RepID=A0AAW6RMR3_9BURK|nr:hypothetical protein [Ottowia sp. 10c7w1]MDG9699866.1 hypothetical protein [Ottowia sp. 10c7w1]
MSNSHQDNVTAKAFTLKFLERYPSVDAEPHEWLWQPVANRNSLEIKTATFSGKNQADDYTNE